MARATSDRVIWGASALKARDDGQAALERLDEVVGPLGRRLAHRGCASAMPSSRSVSLAILNAALAAGTPA